MDLQWEVKGVLVSSKSSTKEALWIAKYHKLIRLLRGATGLERTDFTGIKLKDKKKGTSPCITESRA